MDDDGDRVDWMWVGVLCILNDGIIIDSVHNIYIYSLYMFI